MASPFTIDSERLVRYMTPDEARRGPAQAARDQKWAQRCADALVAVGVGWRNGRRLDVQNLVEIDPSRKSDTTVGLTHTATLTERWRDKHPGLSGFLQAIWRPGVARGKTRVDAWEAANQTQAERVIEELDHDAEDTKDEKRGQPEKRRISAKKVYWNRKRLDRQRRNRLVVNKDLRVINPKTIRVPAIWEVTLDKPLPRRVRAALDHPDRTDARRAGPQRPARKPDLEDPPDDARAGAAATDQR